MKLSRPQPSTALGTRSLIEPSARFRLCNAILAISKLAASSLVDAQAPELLLDQPGLVTVATRGPDLHAGAGFQTKAGIVHNEAARLVVNNVAGAGDAQPP